MNIRSFGLSLALAGACSALAGCEELRHGLRSKSAASSAQDEVKPSGVEAIKSDSPKGFFKSTRLPGAMSDEGREIEKSLGIQ
jgi:hypothetical protein